MSTLEARKPELLWEALADQKYERTSKTLTVLDEVKKLLNVKLRRMTTSKEYLKYGVVAIQADFLDEEIKDWDFVPTHPRYRIDGESHDVWTIEVFCASTREREAVRFGVIRTDLTTDDREWLAIEPWKIAHILADAIRCYEESIDELPEDVGSLPI